MAKQAKKKGRRSVLIETGYSIRELEDLYFALGSQKRVSERTGISVRSLQKYLSNLTRTIPVEYEDKVFDRLAKWHKEHPNAKLPNDPDKIAKLVGIDRAGAEDWLRKRKTRSLRRLKQSLTRLLKENKTIRDSQYREIPVKAIRKFVIPKRYDMSSTVFVTAHLRNGTSVELPIELHDR